MWVATRMIDLWALWYSWKICLWIFLFSWMIDLWARWSSIWLLTFDLLMSLDKPLSYWYTWIDLWLVYWLGLASSLLINLDQLVVYWLVFSSLIDLDCPWASWCIWISMWAFLWIWGDWIFNLMVMKKRSIYWCLKSLNSLNILWLLTLVESD